MKKTLAALAMAIATSANAGFYTGNDLLTRLQGDNMQKALGMYYIAGVADTLSGVVVCAPPTSTLGQTVDLVQQYLIANPATRHISADVLILRLLGGMWPCPKDEKKGTSL